MQIILLDKPFGLTTRQTYRHLKEKNKKIGHAGTLDKFAQGLIVVLTEKDTKQSQTLSNKTKCYLFDICWGVASVTDDVFAKQISFSSEKIPSKLEVLAAIDNLKGFIKQTPPMFCSKSYKGKRMYNMNIQEKMQAIAMKCKLVSILDYKIIHHGFIKTTILIRCSSGFYIRSLARDLGKALGINAAASMIFRLYIGELTVYNKI